MSPCRAALLTPPGIAGIAVIQLRGRRCRALIDKVFRPVGGTRLQSTTGSVLLLGAILDGDEVLDQIILAPAGQDEAFDINCHGGPRIVQRLLQLLQKEGVEITSWQELCESQSIAGEVSVFLAQAKTRMAVLALANQYPGGLTAWVKEQMEGLQNLSLTVVKVQQHATKLSHTYPLAKRLLDPPRVVLSGPANVGKSTLANALTGQAQSLVSDQAGTTRDWTVRVTDINGIAVHLIDTAGRRVEGEVLEQSARARADDQIDRADLVLLVVEAGERERAQIDQQSADLYDANRLLIVVNKSDLISTGQPISDYLYVSAQTGYNLDNLRNQIAAHLGFAQFDSNAPLVFTARQDRWVHELVNSATCDAALNSLKNLVAE